MGKQFQKLLTSAAIAALLSAASFAGSSAEAAQRRQVQAPVVQPMNPFAELFSVFTTQQQPVARTGRKAAPAAPTYSHRSAKPRRTAAPRVANQAQPMNYYAQQDQLRAEAVRKAGPAVAGPVKNACQSARDFNTCVLNGLADVRVASRNQAPVRTRVVSYAPMTEAYASPSSRAYFHDMQVQRAARAATLAARNAKKSKEPVKRAVASISPQAATATPAVTLPTPAPAESIVAPQVQDTTALAAERKLEAQRANEAAAAASQAIRNSMAAKPVQTPVVIPGAQLRDKISTEKVLGLIDIQREFKNNTDWDKIKLALEQFRFNKDEAANTKATIAARQAFDDKKMAEIVGSFPSYWIKGRQPAKSAQAKTPATQTESRQEAVVAKPVETIPMPPMSPMQERFQRMVSNQAPQKPYQELGFLEKFWIGIVGRETKTVHRPVQEQTVIKNEKRVEINRHLVLN